MTNSAIKAVDSTRIDNTKTERAKMIGALNLILASTADLTAQVKTAHWNVKGPHFIGLHKLFDEFYESLGEHVDEIAERIAALGGTVKGRIQDAAEATCLKPYPLEHIDGMAHVRALADAFGMVAKAMREGIDTCEDLNDKVSADLLTQITGDLEKQLWFLEAHLR